MTMSFAASFMLQSFYPFECMEHVCGKATKKLFALRFLRVVCFRYGALLFWIMFDTRKSSQSAD